MKHDIHTLRNARLLKGWTHTDLARETGLTVSAVSQVERGKFWLKSIRRICNALGLRLDEVMIVEARTASRAAVTERRKTSV